MGSTEYYGESLHSIIDGLELEPDDEEISYLQDETSRNDFSGNGVVEKATMFRKKVQDSLIQVKERVNSRQPFTRNSNFTSRKILVLVSLGCMMFFYIISANEMVEDNQVEVPWKQPFFHGSSLGGIHNIGQPAGKKAADAREFGPLVWSPSYTPHAVESVIPFNLYNRVGHYLHDEHRSPFASHMYDKPKEELDAAQKRHEEKMANVRKEWGAWNFTDPNPHINRTEVHFNMFAYRDVKNSRITDSAWQKDGEYIQSFIKEGKSLVKRVLEGVYAEYGHPTKKSDGSLLSEEERERRHKLFQVVISDEKPPPKSLGIAWLTPAAWDGFIRKLLHAMITNDTFFFVLAGQTSAAGHGNNFLQSQAMQFHHLMEPVFDKLGVTLISRNMAMGGLGTLQSALGGAGIYGEADFMWWDSAMTEEAIHCDVFNKQAILSGERVPIILTPYINNLPTETNGAVWYGDLIEDSITNIVPETKNEKQVESLPWAARYVNCDNNLSLCQKYHADCWYPRSDFNPPIKQGQMGGRSTHHPPDQYHKWKGRVVSLIFLQALEATFEVWEAGLENGILPLEESSWHVGESYKKIKKSIQMFQSDEPSPCEKLLKNVQTRICKVAMMGATEYTPRRNGDESSIHSLIKPAPNGSRPKLPKPLYPNVDIALPSFDIPIDHVDAHAIAIATYYPPPDLDHSWSYETNRNSPDDRNRILSGQHSIRPSKNSSMENPLTSEYSPFYPSAMPNTKIKSSTEYRQLPDDEVIPGQGWEIYDDGKNGFCDGSSNSVCGRHPHNDCLMYAHNDGRAKIMGDGLSGWLVLELPRMMEGIILSRMEMWSAQKSSSEYDSRRTLSYENMKGTYEKNVYLGDHRGLEANVPPYPSDFRFDIAINKEIVKSWNREEFINYSEEVAPNVALYPLLDDIDLVKIKNDDYEGDSIELGLRVYSKIDPKGAGVSISHIYWA